MSFKEFLQEASSTEIKVRGTFIFDQVKGKGETKHGLEFLVRAYRTGSGKFDHIDIHPTDRHYYNYLNIGRAMRAEVKAKDIDHFLKGGYVQALVLPANDRNLEVGDAGSYNFQLDKNDLEKIKEFIGDTSNNTSVRAPRKPSEPKGIKVGIEHSSDTRAIVTVDDDTALELKKQIHDAKSKVQVRIMKRNEGAKVYIDTADKASLDAAVEKAKKIIGI